MQMCPEQDILKLLRGEITARGCAAYRAVLVGNREGGHGEGLCSSRSCPRRLNMGPAAGWAWGRGCPALPRTGGQQTDE